MVLFQTASLTNSSSFLFVGFIGTPKNTDATNNCVDVCANPNYNLFTGPSIGGMGMFHLTCLKLETKIPWLWSFELQLKQIWSSSFWLLDQGVWKHGRKQYGSPLPGSMPVCAATPWLAEFPGLRLYLYMLFFAGCVRQNLPHPGNFVIFKPFLKLCHASNDFKWGQPKSKAFEVLLFLTLFHTWKLPHGCPIQAGGEALRPLLVNVIKKPFF